MATAALAMVKGTSAVKVTPKLVQQKIESIFELAVSPGVANKFFTPQQMMTLAEVVGGEEGTMEYTPDHQIHLKIPTTVPEQITEKLQEVGFLLARLVMCYH